MTKLTAIIAKSDGGIACDAECSTSMLSEFCGGNTGNIVFWKAVCQMLNNYELVYWDVNPTEINTKYKALIWPASNDIGAHDAGQGGKGDYLQQINIPLFVVGLGVQAVNIGDEISISIETQRLAKIASQKTTSIGVRGAFSRNVLSSMGIKNTTIIGCPSLHINPNPNLGSIIAMGINRKWNKIIVAQNNIAMQGGIKHFNAEMKLIRWMIQRGGQYICQHPSYVFDLIKHQYNMVPQNIIENLIKLFEINNVKDIVEKFVRVYTLIPEWSYVIRQHDVCIGARLHSNLLAIANGVPGIVVPIDSRTREMAETCKLPIVEMEDIEKCTDMEELKGKIKWDGADAFDINRIHLRKNYTETTDI